MSRRELFGSLCATVFLVNLARVVFAPLLRPVAADLQVSAAALGIVASAAWLGSAAPRLPTGYLLTRLDRHVVVAATGALLVLTSAFTAFAGSVEHLAVGAFLMGLSSGIYFIAANPLVSELFPERVGRAIGVHGMSSQLASVVAPVLVTAVLFVGDWQTTFFVVSAAAAIATLVVVWGARVTELPAAGVEDRSLLAAARSEWPIVLTGIVIIGAAGFCWNALFNLYTDYLVTVKGFGESTSRLLLSVLFVPGVLAFLLTGRLADRFPNVPLMLTVGGSFAAAVAALTLARGVLAVAAVSLVVGYAFFSIPPAIDTYLLASLPDDRRASAYSLYSASMMFVQALGSGTVGTLVATGASYTATFQVLAVVVGGVMVATAVLYRAGRVPEGRRSGTPDGG